MNIKTIPLNDKLPRKGNTQTDQTFCSTPTCFDNNTCQFSLVASRHRCSLRGFVGARSAIISECLLSRAATSRHTELFKVLEFLSRRVGPCLDRAIRQSLIHPKSAGFYPAPIPERPATRDLMRQIVRSDDDVSPRVQLSGPESPLPI